jgi:hypothetical protein
MTKCPWFGCDVDPDPASLGLGVGEGGICLVCHMQYVVAAVDPYRLSRDAVRSAPTILALARTGTGADRAQHLALLSSRPVAAALRELGVAKKHR